MIRTACLKGLLLGAALAATAPGAIAQDPFPVTVQLKWRHQFQFAGYYAALEQGFFRDAGLDVTLLEGGADVNPTGAVLSGAADFGIGTSSLLIDRSRGLPVVAVASVFQHSPYVLIARQDPAITRLRDLEGRTIMVEPHAEELIAYLKHESVRLDAVNMVPHSGDVTDLAAGRVAASTAYTTTEPYILNEAGIPFRVFDPKSAGIDFYGDTLFTSEKFAREHEDVVVAFRDAMAAGWRHAYDHLEDTLDLLERKYGSRLSRGHLQFEANTLRPLLLADYVPVGYMNPARWRHIAEEFGDAGLLQGEVDLGAFLFTPAPPGTSRMIYGTLLIALLVILVISLALLKFITLNRSLRHEIAVRTELQAELQRQARTDAGTGVFNRRGFLAAAEREISRANRRGSPVSLLALDLDHFKSINDNHGHVAGDRALAQVAAALARTVREIDVLGRVGGEEFMVLLPDTAIDHALEIAERLRRTVETTPVGLEGGTQLDVTTSVGVAERAGGEDLSALMNRADQAMYEAKRAGRNRTEVSRAEPGGGANTGREIRSG